MIEPDANGMVRLRWMTGAVVLPKQEMRSRIEADGTHFMWMEEVRPGRTITEEEWRTVCRAREIMGDDL